MTAINKPAILISPIADEVMRGLSAPSRELPPKLFYDAAGSHLFEQITETPEYYPTRTERAILKEYAGAIVSQAGPNLTLVELGAGSASKTQVLIQALLRRQLRADFYPVDVSSSALQSALATLNGHFPRLRVSPIVADYTHHLPDLRLRFVNIVDLFKMQLTSDHPHGSTEREFDSLFTVDKPIIFNFHGYPSLIHKLAYRFRNHDNLHVHGYMEKGNINTPLELAILNRVDRFNLVIDVIDRVPRLRNKAAHLKEEMRNTIIDNLSYARTHGTDRPEFTEWVWPG